MSLMIMRQTGLVTITKEHNDEHNYIRLGTVRCLCLLLVEYINIDVVKERSARCEHSD